MPQQRVHKPVRKPASTRAQQDKEDAPNGRQEVREDVRRTWWPEA
ncbi:hypothetical protein ACGF5F_29490 [Streptomyces sp. NPDC047821]